METDRTGRNGLRPTDLGQPRGAPVAEGGGPSHGTAGFSGDGGAAASAELSSPEGVAVDSSGNLVISDFGNNRVRVVAQATGTFFGQAMTAGDMYTVAGNHTEGYSGDGGPANSAALNLPFGVAVDGSGNLVVADAGNNRTRVVAAIAGTFYGVAMSAGDIYAVAGNGTNGYSGDGSPATSAELYEASGVAVDGAGDLFIADFANFRIRLVTGGPSVPPTTTTTTAPITTTTAPTTTTTAPTTTTTAPTTTTTRPTTTTTTRPTTTTTVPKDAPTTVWLKAVPPWQLSTGQPVVFTALVSRGAAKGTLSGTMTFTANGGIIRGCGSVPVILGIAVCATFFSNAGTYTIVAAYSGNVTFGPSSANISEKVTRAR